MSIHTKLATLVTALLVGTSAGRVTAQAPAETKLVGTWRGTLSANGTPHSMVVTIDRSGATWTVTDSIADVPEAGPVRDLVVEGGHLTWKQTFGDLELTFKGTLDRGELELVGTADAARDGHALGTGEFTLARR